MYISSKDRYHGDCQSFIIQTYQVPLQGQWYVSLAELYADKPITTETFICTNIIEESTFGVSQRPILRRVYEGKHFIFNPEQFHKLSTNGIGSIAIYFIAENIQFERVDLTLHFKKYGKLE